MINVIEIGETYNWVQGEKCRIAEVLQFCNCGEWVQVSSFQKSYWMKAETLFNKINPKYPMPVSAH